MTTKTNKILSAAIAIVIIFAVAVLVYVTLPRQTNPPSGNTNGHNITSPIFSITYGDHQTNFTLSDLADLPSFTAKGGYRTQSGFIKGVGNYTGVNITTLVDTFQIGPFLYSLKVISQDGNTTYNYTTIKGNVDIYNPDNASDPNPIGKGNLTMVLAYKFEGNWLNESTDGKLKIVFLDEKGSITRAALWWKKVESIKIITE